MRSDGIYVIPLRKHGITAWGVIWRIGVTILVLICIYFICSLLLRHHRIKTYGKKPLTHDQWFELQMMLPVCLEQLEEVEADWYVRLVRISKEPQELRISEAKFSDYLEVQKFYEEYCL
eukprot:GHVH01015870.1.p1 GENE.GHVH01015870.1~~GHVH01015870.1.p1  ORF type:complete len:119 (-),score=5.60 GHVH01015870.1:68-424(-)